jgi:hypothetical protein
MITKIEELVISKLGTRRNRKELLTIISNMDFNQAMDAIDLFLFKLNEINYGSLSKDIEEAIHLKLKKEEIEDIKKESLELKEMIVDIEVNYENHISKKNIPLL